MTELFHSQCIDYFVQRNARDLLHPNIPGTNGRILCMVDDAWDSQRSVRILLNGNASAPAIQRHVVKARVFVRY